MSTNSVASEQPEIVCDDNRPRIAPGEYRAYCRAAKSYFDKALGRWVVMLSFDVLADHLFDAIAKRVPLFFNLGKGERPKSGRRSNFHYAWVPCKWRRPGTIGPHAAEYFSQQDGACSRARYRAMYARPEASGRALLRNRESS